MKIFFKKYLFIVFLVAPIYSMEMEPKAKEQPAQQIIGRAATTQFTLPVPIAGTNQNYTESVDFKDQEDVVASATLLELRNDALKEDRDFILARVSTRDQVGKSFAEYYELPNLHKWLFGGNLFPANPDNLKRYLQTPRKADIVGDIYYFIYNSATNSFDYFASDHEVIKLGNPLFKDIITVNYTNSSIKILLLVQIADRLIEANHPQLALKYYERAARLGDGYAMYKIGHLYETGIGFPSVDYVKAAEWYDKGSRLGNPQSMYQLASMYEAGKGLPSPDYYKAGAFYVQAYKSATPRPSYIL